ncbi:hypothetical protein LDENG_00042730, partial [Lucifuga dentata]
MSAGSSYHQTIQSIKDRVQAVEGDTVTLSCSYSSADSFSWYRQYSSSSPQLLITEYSNKPGFMFKVDKANNKFHLELPSPAASDSAV